MESIGTNAIDWPLICPTCRSRLDSLNKDYRCNQCDVVYAADGKVIHFVPADDFYEGKYTTLPLEYVPNPASLLGRFWLYQYSQHYLWYITQFVPPGGRLLDVAGGAGMLYLTTEWRTAGLEISSPHAYEMARHYEVALRANGLRIPLETASLDAVVSRFFLEHVPRDEKVKLLAEFRRVLRPGGWLVTLQDCDCHNPVWQWAKRDPVLFQRHVVDHDGHYGLLLPSENLQLMREGGFDIVRFHATNKTPLVSLPLLEWMQPYRTKSRRANLLLGAAHFINGNRWLTHAYNLTMTLWDDVQERLLPLDHARYLLAVCKSIS
jgi:SAM-dependent methyltransferase